MMRRRSPRNIPTIPDYLKDTPVASLLEKLLEDADLLKFNLISEEEMVVLNIDGQAYKLYPYKLFK